MRLSQKLRKKQAELDFIDIDPTRDTKLYLDPQLISASKHPLAEACHAQIEGFFQHFLNLLRANRKSEARSLFNYLHEPNETCLGQSIGSPSGRGIGAEQATQLFESIVKSKAAKTGVLEHLEDCSIFIEGIGADKVSDMTTNILRGQLISYTQQQCELHRLSMNPNTAMGPIWDNRNRRWIHITTNSLILKNKPILLVPKSFVSIAKIHTLDKYHRNFVLEHIRQDQLSRNGPFVHRRFFRNGTEKVWVVKKELKEKIAPTNKDWVSSFTGAHPQVFKKFKQWVKKNSKPLPSSCLPGDDDIGKISTYLEKRLREIKPGSDEATAYHDLMLSVLELLFHPSLTNPRKEQEIHEGRKRIDITFDNAATTGFFYALHKIHQLESSYIMIECKNYGSEIGNPEVDQLAGRFGVNRGKVGILLCRTLANRAKLIQRCRDTLADGRGLILPLTDENIAALLKAKADEPDSRPEESLLADIKREIHLN